MLKKVAANTTVLALLTLSLASCSSGKLTTQETCNYINGQVAEKNLEQKADDVSEQVFAGETKEYAKIMNEFEAILTEGASRSKDKKLVDALNAASAQNHEAAELMAQGTSENVTEISEKIAALETDEASEATAYLDESCPDMASFS
ncbi:hypothetical protein [Glutamicibacter sp.]|uniref:hypothetical protein n=1 Tax=Glutamicibacter sp. TaxID=1931995 RepID=UPI002FE29169